MKRLVRLLVILLALCIGTPITDGFAQKKTVHVKEYTKKDGTTVKAHDRKAPSEKRASTAPKTPKAKPEKAARVKTPAVVVTRNERVRIQRSDAARHAFARQTGYPNGRPGYIIDHILPLACGGVDAPSNMQWQTIAAGKAKDKSELVGCR
jgi:hypothetical protein